MLYVPNFNSNSKVLRVPNKNVRNSCKYWNKTDWMLYCKVNILLICTISICYFPFTYFNTVSSEKCNPIAVFTHYQLYFLLQFGCMEIYLLEDVKLCKCICMFQMSMHSNCKFGNICLLFVKIQMEFEHKCRKHTGKYLY